MLIAGVEIPTEAVSFLIVLLRAEYYFKAAETLEAALGTGIAQVGLTIRERTAILDVLDDPPEEFADLRGTLLAEHTWRKRVGLASGGAG